MISCGVKIGGNSIPVPASIPNLALWFRSDLGVNSTLGKVSAWTDQSGTGKQFIQGNGAAQPDLVADVFNGRPSIRFAGAQYMQADLATVYTKPVTIFVVGRRTADVETNHYLLDGGSFNTCVMQHLFGIYRIYSGGIVTTSNIPTGTFTAMCGVFNGVTSVASINGVEVAGNAGTNSNSGFTIGSRGGGGGQYLTGDIIEIVIYNRALTLVERVAMNKYLGF